VGGYYRNPVNSEGRKFRNTLLSLELLKTAIYRSFWQNERGFFAEEVTFLEEIECVCVSKKDGEKPFFEARFFV
jgi:hypothetical protein